MSTQRRTAVETPPAFWRHSGFAWEFYAVVMSDPHPPQQSYEPGPGPLGSGQPAGDFPSQASQSGGYDPADHSPPPGAPPHPPQQPVWQPPPSSKEDNKSVIMAVVAGVLVLLCLGGGGVGLLLFSSEDGNDSAEEEDHADADADADTEAEDFSDAEVNTPQSSSQDGYGVVVGAEDAEVTVEIYSDFSCPACANFWQDQGSALEEPVDNGDLAVVYHPVTVMDRVSEGTGYSTRAAASVACAADEDETSFFDYYSTLMQEQPARDTEGLDDSELVELGADVGLGGGFESCVTDGEYHGWAYESNQAYLDKFDSTPTVLVDGEVIEDQSTLLDVVGDALRD